MKSKNYMVDTEELEIRMIRKKIRNRNELSRISGINRNTISKILNGEIRPSTTVMEKLISTLDIEEEEAGKIFFVKNLRNT